MIVVMASFVVSVFTSIAAACVVAAALESGACTSWRHVSPESLGSITAINSDRFFATVSGS